MHTWAQISWRRHPLVTLCSCSLTATLKCLCMLIFPTLCSVTRTEGRRYIDRQAERETLREEVFKHLKEKGIDIEPIIKEQQQQQEGR